MKPTDRRPREDAPAAPIHHHDPAELHNEGVAHEHSDINVRAIVVFLAALATIGIVVHFLMWGVFELFERQAAANDRPLSPVAIRPTQMQPTTTESTTFGAAPKPQLLTNEPRALQMQRQSEAEKLTGYGWIDEKTGIARIPIDEAKKLIVERGLPVRRGEPVSEALGTALPARGESSSGRTVDGPPRGAGLPPVAQGQSPPPGAQPPAPAHKPGGGHE